MIKPGLRRIPLLPPGWPQTSQEPLDPPRAWHVGGVDRPAARLDRATTPITSRTGVATPPTTPAFHSDPQPPRPLPSLGRLHSAHPRSSLCPRFASPRPAVGEGFARWRRPNWAWRRAAREPSAAMSRTAPPRRGHPQKPLAVRKVRQRRGRPSARQRRAYVRAGFRNIHPREASSVEPAHASLTGSQSARPHRPSGRRPMRRTDGLDDAVICLPHAALDPAQTRHSIANLSPVRRRAAGDDSGTDAWRRRSCPFPVRSADQPRARASKSDGQGIASSRLASSPVSPLQCRSEPLSCVRARTLLENILGTVGTLGPAA